ncbi:MAG: hypothetical protein V1487_03340 [bacterium]
MLSVSTQIARDDSLSTFAAMLSSVAFADELIIFNMERTDNPALELFKQFKARVINIKTPVIVETIREQQVREAQSDWVLVMDYDEIIPPTLKDEILTLIANLASCSAYAIPRDNYSLGFPLHHGGWERDYVVRLIRRADFLEWPKNIHSSPKVRGCTIKTIHSLEHHKDLGLTQMVDKTNRYSCIEADQYFTGRLPLVTPLTLIRKWWMESLRRGVFKRGLLDGKIGLIQSLYQGFSVFISYAKLYELQLLSKSTTLPKFPKQQKLRLFE